jgi:hypothetical protein
MIGFVSLVLTGALERDYLAFRGLDEELSTWYIVIQTGI